MMSIEGRIARDDMPKLCKRLQALIANDGGGVIVCDVEALQDPDAVSVDALARLQLTAQRLGRNLQLRGASDELQELLALTGLEAVVPCHETPGPDNP